MASVYHRCAGAGVRSRDSIGDLTEVVLGKANRPLQDKASEAEPTSPLASVATPAGRATADVVIGKECHISGKLNLRGTVQIDGAIDGELVAQDEVVVGKHALIEATIKGRVVKVYGRVNGDIECSERLELLPGARITGNIKTPNLAVEDGVSFEGYCSMQQEIEVSRVEEEKETPVVEQVSAAVASKQHP